MRKKSNTRKRLESEEGLKREEMIPDLIRRISPILSVTFCFEIMVSRSATEIVKRDVGSYLMLCLSA